MPDHTAKHFLFSAFSRSIFTHWWAPIFLVREFREICVLISIEVGNNFRHFEKIDTATSSSENTVPVGNRKI